MIKIVTAGMISLALVLTATILYKMPAGSAAPVIDETGRPIPGSMASLEKLELGDIEQWILIRGRDASNPVLLWLHGGPGAAQMPIAGHFNGDLEAHFIVVHWDQRGAGKSNPADFNESTMTFRQFLEDGHELTLYLKTRFGQDKIYLVGHSWGAQLGIRLAQAYPQDYYAYVGVSQVVDPRLAQEIGYAWLMEQVKNEEKGKNQGLLEPLGKPPFSDHEKFVSYIKLIDVYGGGFDTGMGRLAWIALHSPEYSLRDLLAWLDGANRGSGPMWEDADYQSFNALLAVPRIEIPIYFFNGQQDYNTPLQVVREYYEQLDAPKGKRLVVFEGSAHTPFLRETEKFHQEMERVKRETYREGK